MRESSKVYYPDCRALLEISFDSFGPSANDPPPQIVPVLPTRATIHKNSYSQADSWSLEFDALDLPIDPELIRAGAVSIYLFQAPPGGEDRRVLSRQTDALSVGSRATVVDYAAVQQKRADALKKFTYDTAPIVAGLFDENALELNDSGGTVRISGQDYTDFLIKKQWPPQKIRYKDSKGRPRTKTRARPIPVGKRLDLQFIEILKMADPSGRLSIELREIEYEDPKTRKRPKLPIVGAKETRGKKRGIPVEQDTSYWDVMSKLATRYGLIVFVDGLSIVLSRPKNVIAKETDQIRYFAWGDNLSTLNLRRKLSKQQVPQIIIQGYDDRTRKSFEVKYPAKGDPVPTGIGVKKDEELRIPARGISDKEILKEMAKAQFNRMGRSERTVTFSTSDLSDMREDDLLNLSTGDAVSIQFDTADQRLIRDPTVTPAKKVAWLVNHGYGEAIAQTIAKHYQKLEALSRPLRVREVSYNYDVNSGISIEVEAEDFIVVGGDRLSKGAE